MGIWIKILRGFLQLHKKKKTFQLGWMLIEPLFYAEEKISLEGKHLNSQETDN